MINYEQLTNESLAVIVENIEEIERKMQIEILRGNQLLLLLSEESFVSIVAVTIAVSTVILVLTFIAIRRLVRIIFKIKKKSDEETNSDQSFVANNIEKERKPTDGVKPIENKPAVERPLSTPKLRRVLSAINTSFDLDDFMLRAFKIPMVVYRIKGSERNKRCVHVNHHCEFTLYKQFQTDKQEMVTKLYGSPYIRLPLSELLDCFKCEGASDHSFILEFKNKTLQFVAATPINSKYLTDGFRQVAKKIRVDKHFLPNCEKRFIEIVKNPKQTSNTSKQQIASPVGMGVTPSPARATFDHDETASIASTQSYQKPVRLFK